MLIPELGGLIVPSILLSGVTFVGGLLAGLYFDDYREDRDWCRSVDAVFTDLQMTVNTMQTERTHQSAALGTQADRLESLIAETPPYRHSLRRDLESLQEDVESLADSQQYGLPIPDYDHAEEPDDHGELNRIDYLLEQAADLEDTVAAMDQQLSYGLFTLVPKFL